MKKLLSFLSVLCVLFACQYGYSHTPIPVTVENNSSHSLFYSDAVAAPRTEIKPEASHHFDDATDQMLFASADTTKPEYFLMFYSVREDVPQLSVYPDKTQTSIAFRVDVEKNDTLTGFGSSHSLVKDQNGYYDAGGVCRGTEAYGIACALALPAEDTKHTVRIKNAVSSASKTTITNNSSGVYKLFLHPAYGEDQEGVATIPASSSTTVELHHAHYTLCRETDPSDCVEYKQSEEANGSLPAFSKKVSPPTVGESLFLTFKNTEESRSGSFYTQVDAWSSVVSEGICRSLLNVPGNVSCFINTQLGSAPDLEISIDSKTPPAP